MDGAVHAEVEVADESACRVVEQSGEGAIRAVSRAATSGDAVTVEFTADATVDPDEVDAVFRHGDEVVYRFEREGCDGPACACEFVEDAGTPVRDQRVEDGTVVLSFLARDLDALRRIVVGLRTAFEGVSLRRLTRSAEPGDDGDLVLVDRSALTDRQYEVLATAHEMGYFAHPKDANATEVAGALGVNRSTFAEHLSAAQSKLLDDVVDG